MRSIIILFSVVAVAIAGRGCGKNQHYEECGTACPTTCRNRFNPPEACVDICNPGCQCDEGYVQKTNRKCVKPKDCPKPKCGRHERYMSCGTACPLTCDNYENPPPCNKRCNPGCHCERGYVRNGEEKCVKPKNCPAKYWNPIPHNCVDKPESGLCEAYMPMWYYDANTLSCKRFVYGGCGGNGNRFETEEECLKYCKV